MASVQEVVEGIDRLREELAGIRRSSSYNESLRDEKLKTWTRRVCEQLSDWGFPEEAEEGFGRHSSTWMFQGVDKRASVRDDRLLALRDDLASHPDHYASKLAPARQLEPVSVEPTPAKADRVFLGHGRSNLWAQVQIYLRDELRLDVKAWKSESRAGMHSVDVLEALLHSCTFAVIIATGEDTTARAELVQGRTWFTKLDYFRGGSASEGSLCCCRKASRDSPTLRAFR